MKRRLLATLLAASMLLVTLTACGGGGSKDPGSSSAGGASSSVPVDPNNPLYKKPTEEVTLNVWYAVSGVTATEFERQVKAYADANPNIKINLSYAGSYADAASKISANLIQGTAPELALISAAPLYTGAMNDWSIETLVKDPAFDYDDIYDGAWDYVKYQGRVCAIPYGISVPVLYYNTKVLKDAGVDIEKEAPKTWAELYKLAEKVQAYGKANIASTFTGFECSDVPWLYKSMLTQNGNSIIEGDGAVVTPIYNNAEGKEVADFWRSLVTGGLMQPDQHANAEKSFQAGTCAFLVASSVRLSRWAGFTDGTYGALPLPGFDADKNSVALGGNMLATFTKDQAKLAAAWDLIKYLTNTENHTTFATTSGYLPIHESAADSQIVKDAVSKNANLQVAYDMMENSWSYTHFDAMGTMDNILKGMISDLENYSKYTDVQDILDDAVEELEDEM